MKDSFIFYASWREAIKDLPTEIKSEIYEATIDYGLTGIVPELSPMASIAFKFIKNDLDRNNEKYESKKRQCSEAGKKHSGNQYSSGTKTNDSEQNGTIRNKLEQIGTDETKRNETERNGTKRNDLERMEPNVDVDDNVDEDADDNVDENKKSLSLTPSQTEKEKERERENLIFSEFFWLNRKNPEQETQRFVDNYRSQGWKKANGRQITNIAAAVRMWKCVDEYARFDRNHLEVLRMFCKDVNQTGNSKFLKQIKDFKKESDQHTLYCTPPVMKFVESNIDKMKPHFYKIFGNESLRYIMK